jgi:formylglycine-generating enzyme required for sulfatase activity
MGNSARTSHEVGTRRPNPRGLFDMHGNVFEWCQDWHGLYPPSPAPADYWAGPAPDRKDDHVLRGGGWYNHAADCRSAARNYYPSRKFFLLIGFRVARSL